MSVPASLSMAQGEAVGHVVAGRGALDPTPICLSMSEMNKMSMGCHWTGEVLSHTRTAAVCLRKRCLLDPPMLWVPFSDGPAKGFIQRPLRASKDLLTCR